MKTQRYKEPEHRDMAWALALSARLANRETADLAAAEVKLSAKCGWERMTRTGVLIEWGDPRNW